MSTVKCPNVTGNKKGCPCPHINCALHGVCCQCVSYHRGKGELPQCFVKA